MPGVLELLEARARRAGLCERLRARIAELDRERDADERQQHRGRRDRGDPAVAHDHPRPRGPQAPPRARPAARGQSSRGPIVASTTGSSVIATATLTSGMNSPAMPMLRRNGTGSTTSASSAIATVVPLKTTARPGVLHRVRDGGLVGRAAEPLLAPAHDDEQRVVDRDAEPDERDQELDDDETSVTAVSGQISRNVVGTATAAISSGTSAMNEPNTKASTISGPRPASSTSSSERDAGVVGARRGAPAARSASRPVMSTGAPPTVTPSSAACACRASAWPGSSPGRCGM